MRHKTVKRRAEAYYDPIVIHSLAERAKYTCCLSLRATVLLCVPRGPKAICVVRALARDGEMTDILYIDGPPVVIETAIRARFVWIKGLGIRLKARVLGRIFVDHNPVLQIAAFPYIDALAKHMRVRYRGVLRS